MQVYNDEAVYHHGILGMKWGHHRTASDNDRVIKTGTQIHNISKDKSRSYDHLIYGSHLHRDNLNYKSYYSRQLQKYGASKIYDNTFEVKNNIVIPSEKKAVSSFVKLYKQDPKGVSRELAKAKVKTSAYLSIGKMMKINVDSMQYKKYSKMGEKKLKTTGFQDFMKTMPLLDKSRSKYFDSLIKEGYSGMTDYHDVKEFGSKDPLIIFKGDNNVKRTNSLEVSSRDMNLAMSEYEHIKKKESINKLLRKTS